MCAAARWMPFRIEARVRDFRVFISVLFFGKRIYNGYMKQRKKSRKGKAVYEALDLSNTRAKISYGFNEPYLTGIFCAASGFGTVLFRSADIELDPVFFPEDEFLRIDAGTDINAGKTLVNMLKNKIANTGRRKNYGPAQSN